MRSYVADFGQTLNDWNILQMTQLLKIQRTTVTELILLNKSFYNF